MNATLPHSAGAVLSEAPNATEPVVGHIETMPELGHNATLSLGQNATLPLAENATLPLSHNATSALSHNATAPLAYNATSPLAHNATSPVAETVQSTALPPVEFSWGGYFEAIGVMLILLGALWGILWLMRRYGRFRFMPAPGAFPRNGLAVEAQLPLGPRKGLYVVRFLNERLLLGVTDQQITLLKEMYDAEADELGPVNPTDAKTFARLLAEEGGPDHASVKKE